MGGIDYRRIFEATEDPLLVCDAAGQVVDSNERACELLAADRSSLTERSLAELVTPAGDRASPLDAFRARDSGTDRVTFEGTVERAGRAPFTASIRVCELADEYVLVTVRPVDDHRAGTADPARSGALAQLVEHTPDVMWMFSADWSEYVFVNSAYEDVFGRPLSNVREDPADFLQGIHPEDRADVRDAMERLSAGTEIDIEYRVDASTDYERWVWVHGTPIRDDAGEVYRVAGFVREITERHQRQLQLLHQRNLVQNVPIGVFRIGLDDELRIQQANPALVSMLDGTDPTDLLGRNVTEFYHDPDMSADVADRLEREGTVTFEARFETLSGNVFWGRVTTVRQTDESGRRVVDGVIEDITPRKHRQRQLRVVDRILRHNIRNDVSVISGYATHLAESVGPAESDAIDSIVQRSQKLLRTAEKGHVVVDVLSDGREPTKFDVVPDVEETADRLRTAYEGVTIETDLPPSAMVCSLREIDLALHELVENSIVHHDDDPHITIDLVTGVETVEIRISDDGPGIPDREYEILSGTEDVDPLSHGSGMGLWLVHWIVRLSGGDIAFESTADGSTVVVTLPTPDAETDVSRDDTQSTTW